MAKVMTSDPNKLEYRRTDGCFIVAGIPLILFGLLVFYISPLYVALPIGGSCILLGALLATARTYITFDTRLGKMTSVYGIWGIGRATRHDLTNIKMVTLSRVVRRGKNNAHYVYCVQLEGDFPSPIAVDVFGHPSEGHALAETIGKFLDLPMKDSSTGSEVIREAGTLDYSIRQRFEAEGKKPELGPRPENAKSTYTPMEQVHKIHIPPTGLKVAHFGNIAFNCLIFFVLFFSDSATTGPRIFITFIMATIIYTRTLPFVLSALHKTDIEITPTKLVVEKSGPMVTSREEILANDLEGVSLNGPKENRPIQGVGPYLNARSDEKTIDIGIGLEEDELNWLKSIIEVGVCS